MEARIENLVKGLFDKTNKQEAEWAKLGKSEKFSLMLDSGKVTLDKGVTNKGTLYYQFIVMNSNGEGIITVNGLKQDFPMGNDFEALKELHECIKRNYYKTDETLDGLINEIKKEGPIGKTDTRGPWDDLPF